MKKILFLLLFPLALHAQTLTAKIDTIVTGEYNTLALVAGQVYDLSQTPALKIAGQPATVAAISAAFHHFGLVDGSGNAYTWGDNNYGECGTGSTVSAPFPGNPVTLIKTDNFGNPFTGVKLIHCFASSAGYGTLFVKNDGTVWICGATGGGAIGNGTSGGIATRPTQVPGLSGIIQIVGEDPIIARDAAGNVYSWGGGANNWGAYLLGQGNGSPNYNIPTKINFGGVPAVSIAGGGTFSYALLANGHLWGWGYYPNALGITGFASQTPNPIDLTKIVLPGGGTIRQIATNAEVSYLVTTGDSLYVWGDNAQGAAGIGKELNYSQLNWGWSWSWGQGNMVIGSTLSATGVAKVYGSPPYAFYAYIKLKDGRLQSAGRNKAGVLGNGYYLANGADATYPNWGDMTTWTTVTPMDNKTPIYIAQPGGMPATTVITQPPPPVNKAPTAVIPSTYSMTWPANGLQIDGSSSNDSDGTIVFYRWKSAAGAALSDTATKKPMVLLSGPGTYSVTLVVTDNQGATGSATMTITVNAAPAPIICPVCPPPVVCPAPRTVIGMTWTPAGIKFTFSDGTTQ